MKWPEIVLHDVPPAETAHRLAENVRRTVFGAGRGLVSHCDLKKVCEAGGFEVRRAQLGSGQQCSEALLIPVPSHRFRIALNTDRICSNKDLNDPIVRHRNRFRIAHEIAHSFFYDRSRRIPTKLTEDSSEEEKFCDLFASALLMPPIVVAAHVAKPESVFSIRRSYDVSIEAAARAFSESYPKLTVVGLMWKENARGVDSDLRVQWSCGPRFVPRNARLHSNVAATAYENGKSSGTEVLDVGELKGDFISQAAKVPGGALVVMMLSEPNDEIVEDQTTISPPTSIDPLATEGGVQLRID